MRFDKTRQWIGAIYAEDIGLIREMLQEDPALANSAHPEFDDPYRARRFPVATLLFACFGPPNQQVDFKQIERKPNFEMVQTLVENGADVNIDSIHGLPLCFVRDPVLATYLVEQGADVNKWHNNGGSPLFRAVFEEDEAWVGLLLGFGAEPNLAAPDTGETALHLAVMHTNDPACKVLYRLLAAGGDPNQRTKSGVTSNSGTCPELNADSPLHLAAIYALEATADAMIEGLVNAGADKHLRNGLGKTPLDLATERAEIGLQALLR